MVVAFFPAFISVMKVLKEREEKRLARTLSMGDESTNSAAMVAALQQQLAAMNLDWARERARADAAEAALALDWARERARADAAEAALAAAAASTAAAAAAVPSLKPLPSPTAGGAKVLLGDEGYWGLLPAPASFVPPGGVAQAFAPALAAAAGAARGSARAAESLMDEATYYRLAGVCTAPPRTGVRGTDERAQGLWGLCAAPAALGL